MTARHSQAAKPESEPRFVLPDPPEREPEDMTSFDHLTLSGSVHPLVQHLGNPRPPSSPERGTSPGSQVFLLQNGWPLTCS